MYAVMLHGPRDVRIDEVPDLADEPGPGEVHVRTVVSAVSSGTELAAITARYGTPFYGGPFDYPSNLGYLNIGRETAIGAGVVCVPAGDGLYEFGACRGASWRTEL